MSPLRGKPGCDWHSDPLLGGVYRLEATYVSYDMGYRQSLADAEAHRVMESSDALGKLVVEVA